MTREQRAQFEQDFVPLVVARGADFDLPRWTVYARALADVPRALLVAAVERGIKAPRQPYEAAFPEPGTIRAWAEQARQALIAAHPFEGCADCEQSIGWRPRLDLERAVEPCPCRQRHRERLEALGAGAVPLALPAGNSEAWEARHD